MFAHQSRCLSAPWIDLPQRTVPDLGVWLSAGNPLYLQQPTKSVGLMHLYARPVFRPQLMAAAEETPEDGGVELRVTGNEAEAEAFNADASPAAGPSGLYVPHPLSVALGPRGGKAALLAVSFAFYPSLNLVTAGACASAGTSQEGCGERYGGHCVARLVPMDVASPLFVC
jgi:hypothetical protein